MNYLKVSSLPETCISYDLNIKEAFIRLGLATEQKRHLGLFRLRIFKIHWVAFNWVLVGLF